MKKITLLFLTVFLYYGISAQQTISFESTGGYNLGDINGQNGWVTTGTGPGTFVQNQVISDEQSSDGTQSLKIVTETAFGPQMNPVVGAFYDYPSPVSYVDAVFSADFYIDTFSSSSPDYLFGFANTTDEVFITFIRLTFEGNILVLAEDSMGDIVLDPASAPWVPLTWFNLRLELSNNAIEVFLDDTSIYQGLVATPDTDIDNVRFVHDNYTGFAHLDNFRINDEPLSTFDFDSSNFEYFVDAQNYLNLSANDQLENLNLHNMLGQQVLSQNLSSQNETIDLNNLAGGVYLATVQINGTAKTFKILKK